MLLCTSLAEVACNARSIYTALQGMFLSVTEKFQKLPSGGRSKDEIFDPVPESERVPLWMWGSVLIASIIISCVVMGVQFGQNVGVTLLGKKCARLILSFAHVTVSYYFCVSL